MKSLYQFDIHITLIAPWLVQGNDPGKFGLDATLLRDHQGQPVLPGTLLQGRLRHAWTEMREDFQLDMPDPSDWFGTEGDEFAARGRLWVTDLVMQGGVNEPRLSTRVPIDPETGAAQQGMLLMIEQHCLPGTQVKFSGTWRAWLDEPEAQRLQQAILAGLNWQSQLGAQRSVGFGKIEKITIDRKKIEKSRSTSPQGERLRLRLTFDRPICVGARSRRGNVFISSDIISGGTIKGAIASQLRQQHGRPVAELKAESTVARHFDALRITHALPAKGDQRPSVLPLSLAALDEKIFDLTACATPQLINGQAPAFCHDWKGAIRALASQQQGWGQTRRHLRVRTAIDAETRTAKDSQLFAYDCCVAENGTCWLADIDFSTIPADDREHVVTELASLLQSGLGPIGKTDAWANAKLSDQTASVWPQATISGPSVRLQLNSPALLIASAQVTEQAAPDLYAIYQQLFAELSGNSLSLSHYFASHRMAGGEFLKKRQGRKSYRPSVLTEAGSVFIFEVKDPEQAKARLEHWQQHGLPLPEAVVQEAGNDWQRNPYLPQNGYGEIAINLQHGFESPTAQQLTPCFGSEHP
jgi:hypothetical protein